MKDIHSHLLPNIDDGSRSMDESIKSLKHLSNIGVTDLVLTPHYINNSNYNCDNKTKTKLINKLKKELIKNNININLYLGNEIYIDEDILNLIKKGEISTINKTNYILIELPLYETKQDYTNIIEELILNGYNVILAHPERYPFVKENYKNIESYLEMGVLLQGNYASLFNKYGKESKRALKKLIKKGWISFLASDIHQSELPCDENKLTKKLKRYTSKSQIKEMLETNFDKVISNKQI